MPLHFDCVMVKWIQKWGESTWHHHEVRRWQKDCRHHHHHHYGFLKLRQIGSNKWQWQGSYGGQGSGMPVACIEPWLPVSGQSCLSPFSLLLCKQHFILIWLVYLSPHVTLKTWRSNGCSDEKCEVWPLACAYSQLGQSNFLYQIFGLTFIIELGT